MSQLKLLYFWIEDFYFYLLFIIFIYVKNINYKLITDVWLIIQWLFIKILFYLIIFSRLS